MKIGDFFMFTLILITVGVSAAYFSTAQENQDLQNQLQASVTCTCDVECVWPGTLNEIPIQPPGDDGDVPPGDNGEIPPGDGGDDEGGDDEDGDDEGEGQQMLPPPTIPDPNDDMEEGEIDVYLIPEQMMYGVGDGVEVKVYISSIEEAEYCCMSIAFGWDNTKLRLVGATEIDAEATQMAWFPEVSAMATLNEVIPPEDGDGVYIVLAELGTDQFADGDGTLVTTLLFEALEPGVVSIDPTIVGTGPDDMTTVWDGVIPNNPMTGELYSYEFEIVG